MNILHTIYFQYAYLIPWDEHADLLVLEGALSELDSDGASPVDHEVEPPVGLRHRVALRVEVVVGHADADQAAAGLGHHATENHRGTTRRYAILNF